MIFDNPMFLCMIESDYLAIYYHYNDRTANIAYVRRRLPISTIDDLMKHFEYDDFEERLFKLSVSENKERFESFLKLAQLNADYDDAQTYVNFSYIVNINENISHSLHIRYTNEKDDKHNDIINVELITYNEKIGQFNIPVHTFTINNELDQQLEQSAKIVSAKMKLGVGNTLGKKLSDEYINKLWNHIKKAIPCYKTMNLTPGSMLYEEITNDISEGEE